MKEPTHKRSQSKAQRSAWEITKYCPECGVTKGHLVQQRGDYEYHTCSNCGNTTSYRIR